MYFLNSSHILARQKIFSQTKDRKMCVRRKYPKLSGKEYIHVCTAVLAPTKSDTCSFIARALLHRNATNVHHHQASHPHINIIIRKYTKCVHGPVCSFIFTFTPDPYLLGLTRIRWHTVALPPSIGTAIPFCSFFITIIILQKATLNEK